MILFIAGLKVLSDQPPDITAKTLTIQWIQPSWVNATEKFKQYDILVKRLGDNPVEETQQSLDKAPTFTIIGLDSATQYEISVSVETNDGFGKSAFSNVEVLNTIPDKIMGEYNVIIIITIIGFLNTRCYPKVASSRPVQFWNFSAKDYGT